MEINEIKELLQIDGDESPIFMDNAIFDVLKDNLSDSSHIAYAYSYLYLTQYLFRNCKYYNYKQRVFIDAGAIREILGYSKTNKTMNYLTVTTKKEEGLLDQLGLTQTKRDIPVFFEWDKDENVLEDFAYHSEIYEKELEKYLPAIPKRFTYKYPVTALEEREVELEDDEYGVYCDVYGGTFYDVSNTHSVDFDIFMFCMSKKELGVIGFYLYSWLKHKNDIHDGGYSIDIVRLALSTGLAKEVESKSKTDKKTLLKYLKALRSYGLVTVQHNQDFFVLGMKKSERQANTYYTNGLSNVTGEIKEFAPMQVMPRAEYDEMLKKKESENKTQKFDFDLSELPY